MNRDNPWNTVFINHFHTEKSRDYLGRFTDAPDWKGQNHLGSPLKILEHLSRGQKAVISLSEHYATNGLEFFEELGEEAESLGGRYELRDRSLILEHDGAKVALINGVEASYKQRDKHVVISGLTLSDNDSYYNLNEGELGESLSDAIYAYPAHPFLGDFGMEFEELSEVCGKINSSQAELFIPFTYAYNLRIDKQARGYSKSENDILDIQEEFEAPFIVEHDHHVHLPSSLAGMGLLQESAFDKLEKGEIPLEEIEVMQIVEPTRMDTFRDLFRAGRTFADQLPNYMEWKNLWKRLSFPYGEQELKAWRDRYYSVELDNLDIEDLRERSWPLNS